MSEKAESLKDEASFSFFAAAQAVPIRSHLTSYRDHHHLLTCLHLQGSRRQVLIAGGVAGLVSRFCIAPLDVIKIRLQLQTYSLSDPSLGQRVYTGGPVYKGTYGAFRSILRDEGIRAFWKGNIPAEILYITYGSLQFSLYHTTSAFLSSINFATTNRQPLHIPPHTTHFLSGALAGGLATTITYPLDLLRTRFAAQAHGPSRIYTSLASSILTIAREEGPTGFCRGSSAAIAGIVPYMGLFFASYEALKAGFSSAELPTLPIGAGDAVAGVLASVAAKTAVFPLDTVRKRLQVQGPTRGRYVNRDIPLYKGVISTVRTIVRREGMKGLYRGLPVSLVKAAPASAVTMWTFERALRTLKAFDLGTDEA